MILILSVGSPLLELIHTLLQEMLAQRMERDTRQEFYTNLLGKSQSFHDQQRIGDIMARTTNDVRMLNYMVSPGLALLFQSFTGLIIPILFIALLFPTQLLLVPIAFTITFLITLTD